jgi:transcriptional regulator with XRE-family HTH domain
LSSQGSPGSIDVSTSTIPASLALGGTGAQPTANHALKLHHHAIHARGFVVALIRSAMRTVSTADLRCFDPSRATFARAHGVQAHAASFVPGPCRRLLCLSRAGLPARPSSPLVSCTRPSSCFAPHLPGGRHVRPSSQQVRRHHSPPRLLRYNSWRPRSCVRRKPTTRDPLYQTIEYLDFLGRVAANVRRARDARGWTQEEAAAHCGQLSVYVLRQIEGAHTNVTAVTLARLSAGFGVDVATFLLPAPTPPHRAPGRPVTIPRVTLPDPASIRRQNGSLGAEPIDKQAAEATGSSTLAEPPPSSLDVSTTTLEDAANPSRDPIFSSGRNATPQISISTRLAVTEVVVPTYPSARTQTFTLPALRDFIATVLAANADGLTASELLHAARIAGQDRLLANNLHYALHHLVRSGYVQRTGSRGSYLHRWVGSKPAAAARLSEPQA